MKGTKRNQHQDREGLRSIRLLPEMIAIAAIVLARFSGTLQFLEWSALDAGLRLRPSEPMDERIVIIGIQEEDIRKMGTYPIPDRALAQLLTTLQSYQPAVIGLDIFRDLPVEPGHVELTKVFQSNPNLIGVEKVLPATVNPPQGVASEQIGFADVMPDSDGKLRRSLLSTATEQGGYRFSLSIRLAASYLKTQGLTLDNGVRDPDAMRFGTTELTRFDPNAGGYIQADAGGNQMLISFRSGRHPFRILSLQDLQSGVDRRWLRDKIVLVGYMAPSVKDLINTAALVTDNPSLVYGVEIQAHVVSQIVSATLDGRSLLQVWSDGWEYVWIVGWGIVGIGIGRLIRSPSKSFLVLMAASAGLIAGSYGLLVLGWWVPVVPAFLVLMMNGAGLAAFYHYDEALRSRVKDRQIVIDQTFDAIHNGPLQRLAQLLRQLPEKDLPTPMLLGELQQLNQELRDVYEVVRREALLQDDSLYLEHDRKLDLQAPLHQVLYDVYIAVLERDFSGFKTLKLQVVKFEPLDEQFLTTEQKRGLCRFLEEALCNVGKHARGATRLDVTCSQIQQGNVIRVADNGTGWEDPNAAHVPGEGIGTRQAKNLAKQLGGQFQRFAQTPKGTICELTWRVKQGWFRRSRKESV